MSTGITLRVIWHHSLLLSLSLPLYNAQWARRWILVIFGFYIQALGILMCTRIAGNFTGVHYGCSGWVVAINEQVTTYGTTDHSLPAPLPVSGLRERAHFRPVSATQPRHFRQPLIGPDWSRDLNTGLWLDNDDRCRWLSLPTHDNDVIVDVNRGLKHTLSTSLQFVITHVVLEKKC